MENPNELSLNEVSDDANSFLDSELEALKSIYINELKVEVDSKSTTLSIDLYPATADKIDEQYVRMTLQFELDEKYPEAIPKVDIRNSRGLSEEKLNSIMKDLLSISDSKKGNSMLFEMIEAAKEHLTTGNRPCGECAICLHGFSDDDVFTKTECYHYFHSHCLARLNEHFRENADDYETDLKSKDVSNELLCPMCRVPINFTGFKEDYPPPKASDDGEFMLTEDMIELQLRMSELFQKQVEKGGIIDIEAEKNKYLIEISDVPTRVRNDDEENQPDIHTKSEVADDDTDTKVLNSEPSDILDSPVKEKKGYRERNQQPDFGGKNKNYNRQSENRGNYNRYGRKYNRQSYNDSREHNPRSKEDRYSQNFDHNRGRYSRNSTHPREVSKNVDDEESQLSNSTYSEGVHDSTTPSDTSENRTRETRPKPHYDSALPRNTAEVEERETRHKPHYNYSPRRNRGNQNRGYSNYNPRYNGARRSGKPYYQERQNSYETEKHETANDDEDTSRSEEHGHKRRTPYDTARKNNYKYDNYRQNFDYNRERYPENRNAQRGSRRGYGRRGNYSNDSNYGKDRYRGHDRDPYYNERDRNFRDREQFRDSKYKNNETQDRYKPRNFPRNNFKRHNEEEFSHVSKETNDDSADISSRSPSSDSNQLSVESEKQDSASGGAKGHSKPETTTQVDRELPSFSKVCSIESTEQSQAGNGITFPCLMKDKPQGSLWTAVNPPPGFANPMKKVIYGLQGANPPPGFNKS